jgi:GDP-L-fucose synthase
MGFMQDKNAPVFVAGHRGMIGSAIWRRLQAEGFSRLICRSRQELDLRNGVAVRDFFKAEKPKYVFLAAAKVGGIKANNDDKTGFLLENLQIQNNVIESALEYGVEKLLFLGSSCIYPKLAPQPMPESALLTGPLEPTNEGYALAKIAGLKLCEYINREKGRCFISAMPTNLYGVGDNFHPEKSHVIPALIRKFHEAKRDGRRTVEIWGTGAPRREFLFADDCAHALVHIMDCYSGFEHINVGCGEDMTIGDLANLIAQVVGFKGDLAFNPSYPDGTPRKLLDVSRLQSLGWRPQTDLASGLRLAYQWALKSGALS